MYRIFVYKEAPDHSLIKIHHGSHNKYSYALALAAGAGGQDVRCVSVVNDENEKTVYQRFWDPYCVDIESMYTIKEENEDIKPPENFMP